MWRHTGLLGALIVGLAIFGCRELSDSRDVVEVHPTLGKPAGAQMYQPAGIREKPEPLQQGTQGRSHIQVRRIGSIGTLDGRSEYVLGDIVDAAILDDLHFVILDSEFHKLRVFDREGGFITELGRAGNGPGEWQYPAALAVGGQDIFVLDENLKILRFRWDLNARSLAFIGAINTSVFAEDICVLADGRLALHGFNVQSDAIIHLLDPSGNPTESFGRKYESDSSLLSRNLSRGWIECVEDGVALGLQYLPRVRLYSTSGDLLWESSYEAFEPVEVYEYSDGTVSYTLPNTGGASFGVGIKAVGEEGLLLTQVQRGSGRGDLGMLTTEPLKSYTVDALSGVGGRIGDLGVSSEEFGKVLDIGNGWILTYSSDPFPRISMWEYGDARLD